MKKKAMKIEWERFFPPGFDWRAERAVFAGCLSFGCVWAILGYSVRLWDGLSALERDNVLMPTFGEVLGSALMWFPVIVCLMLASIILHYAYHHSGSKSVYLMRRLPDRWERHRRAILAPLVSALITAALGAVLFFVFYGIYMAAVPAEVLLPDQLGLLVENWRVN